MSALPIHKELDKTLAQANAEGGFDYSVVSTQHGLAVASAGGTEDNAEILAALAGIFDEVVIRASRDVGLHDIDEVTIRSANDGRLVVRTLAEADGVRLFLVCAVPGNRTWRRVTNGLCRKLERVLQRRDEADDTTSTTPSAVSPSPVA